MNSLLKLSCVYTHSTPSRTHTSRKRLTQCTPHHCNAYNGDIIQLDVELSGALHQSIADLRRHNLSLGDQLTGVKLRLHHPNQIHQLVMHSLRRVRSRVRATYKGASGERTTVDFRTSLAMEGSTRSS